MNLLQIFPLASALLLVGLGAFAAGAIVYRLRTWRRRPPAKAGAVLVLAELCLFASSVAAAGRLDRIGLVLAGCFYYCLARFLELARLRLLASRVAATSTGVSTGPPAG